MKLILPISELHPFTKADGLAVPADSKRPQMKMAIRGRFESVGDSTAILSPFFPLPWFASNTPNTSIPIRAHLCSSAVSPT